MKIGPVNLSYRACAYAVIAALALMVLLRFWSANSGTRLESICRNTILRGTFDDDPESLVSAIGACRTILGSSPGKVRVKLYLGSLLLRDKDNPESLKEAAQVFDEAAQAPAATAEEKAWAFTSAGVAHFMAAGSAAQNTAIPACEKRFQDALAAYPKCTDARINLALLQVLKGGPDAAAQAERELAGLPASGAPSSLRTQVQLHQLQGWLAAKRGNMPAALDSYARAQALRPDRDDLAAARRRALLASVCAPGLEAKNRQALLLRINRELSAFGAEQVSALNAMGLAWMQLKASPETAKNWYEQAAGCFGSAIKRDPADLRGYVNRAVLIEERAAELAGPQTEKTKGAALNALIELYQQLEATWGAYAEHQTETGLKCAAKLRQLAALRRQWLALSPGGGTRPALGDRILALANELVKLDEKNGELHFALGEVLLERADYAAARKAFQAALAHKAQAPALPALSSALEEPPAILRVRPGAAQRWYGSVPLIQVTFKSATPVSAFKEAVMTLDGKPVQTTAAGSQLFYAAENPAALEGSHTLSLSATDALGNVFASPKISLGLDRQKPTVKVSPASTAILSTSPKWTVTFSDESGVDATSIGVLLKAIKSATPLARELVKGGRYKVAMPEANPPVKSGAFTGESFTVSSGGELPPGEYLLTFSAQDLEGNLLTETKTYTVQ